jgi:hypothetical protein
MRSNSKATTPTRIDLMFRAVTGLKLRNTYETIEIDVMGNDEALRRVDLNQVELVDRFVFIVGPPGPTCDYIVAGSLHFAEDRRSDQEPSSLEGPAPDEVIVVSHYREAPEPPARRSGQP